MSDYCVLCWSEKRQKASAVTEVNQEPLCLFHAKLQGWEEPTKPTVAKDSLCHCGKTKGHSGRHRGSLPVNKKSSLAIETIGKALEQVMPSPAESIIEVPDAPPFVTLKVTEAHLDRFWSKLPIGEKARIVESLL